MGNFNYYSLRAREARLGKVLGKSSLMVVLTFIMFLLIALGVFALAYLKNSLGWGCFSIAILIMMLLYWTKKELVLVPVGKSNDINDVLSNDVLAALPKNPSVKDVAIAVAKTTSGAFLNVRYGIGKSLLLEIAEALPKEVGPVFQTAQKIQEGTNSEEIHGAILAVALIANYPANETVLKQMRLEMVDLLDGIIWFNYLNGLVKGVSKHRHNGGILSLIHI